MSFAYVPSPSADGVRTLPDPEFSLAQSDRRTHQRFPINVQAQYIVAGNRAQATMQDIGNGGLFLKIDKTLRLGQQIQVLIDWPAPLDQRWLLRLVVFGKVLRSNGAGTAVRIVRYEFRVRTQNALSAVA